MRAKMPALLERAASKRARGTGRVSLIELVFRIWYRWDLLAEFDRLWPRIVASLKAGDLVIEIR